VYTLEESLGDFVLSPPNLKIPKSHPNYSINEGNAANWDDKFRCYVQSRKFPEKDKSYSLRYIGSMVAYDLRTLLYAGIFMYPPDRKNPPAS